MDAVKTVTPYERKHLPYGIKPILEAWHLATASFLDAHARCDACEDMYAVLDAVAATRAIAVLTVKFARYAKELVLSAQETETQILLHAKGRCRVAGKSISYASLIPKRAVCRALFEEALAQSNLAYRLTKEKDMLTLTVAMPRFLADKYDVATVDKEDVCERFFEVMRFLSGEITRDDLKG